MRISISDDIGGSGKHEEIWVTHFDEDSAQKFRVELLSAAKGDPTRPITLYIDSYGGNVDALAKMIECIDEIQNPVITVALGKAMSCGAILLSHGDLRFCGEHSRVMVHEVSGGTYGDVHDMYADSIESKRLNEYFLGLMARNCGYKSYEEFRTWLKQQDGRDRYLNAQQAKDFGIVDVIGLPRVTASIQYEIRAATEPKLKKPAKKKPAKTTAKPDKKTDTKK